MLSDYRPPLPPGNIAGTHFSWRLSQPQGHSATGRVMLIKYSNGNIGNQTRDLAACSACLNQLCYRMPMPKEQFVVLKIN
jgi:hypothetical protein